MSTIIGESQVNQDIREKANQGSSQPLTSPVKGVNILQEWKEIFSDNVDNTVRFHPDRLWHDLGFSDTCPLPHEVYHRIDQIGSLTTTQGDIPMDKSSFINQFMTDYDIPQDHVQLREFYTSRNEAEQQLILRAQTAGASDYPARGWREALPGSSQQLAQIFMLHGPYKLDRRSYFVFPFIIEALSYRNFGIAQAHGMRHIGLHTLADQYATGNFSVTNDCFCVLWDNFNPGDDAELSMLALASHQVWGKPLCLVLTDQAAWNGLYTIVPAPAIVSRCQRTTLDRFYRFMDDVDRKMLFCMQHLKVGAVDFTDAQNVPNNEWFETHSTKFYPHYSFLDHLIWWLAEGVKELPVSTYNDTFSASNIASLIQWVNVAIAVRKADFFRLPIFRRGLSTNEMFILDPFTRYHSDARLFEYGYLPYHAAPMLMSFVTGHKLLAPIYRPESGNNTYVLTATGNSLLGYNLQQEEGQPYFIPYGVVQTNVEPLYPNQGPGAIAYRNSLTLFHGITEYYVPTQFLSGSQAGNRSILPYFIYISQHEKLVFKRPAMRVAQGWRTSTTLDRLIFPNTATETYVYDNADMLVMNSFLET